MVLYLTKVRPCFKPHFLSSRFWCARAQADVFTLHMFYVISVNPQDLTSSAHNLMIQYLIHPGIYGASIEEAKEE